ncbi:MAG TPA: helicase C-terminal domain-containing protein [Longimicrobiaceae bacterium]|nr:helicase C-terminal domain-containing protein [Longimicrobiaceae bacterium]
MPPSTSSDLYLTLEAAELIRREIARARGNEVCFLARVGDDGEVVEPRVVARGHATAVLATVRSPEPGGLLVHNHPSGRLDPSEADLAVAAQLWEQGVGFAITDNEASALYVVVEPPAEAGAEPLDLDRIDADLGPDGPVAARHPRYEDRPQQRGLSRMIAGVYNEGGVGIAEAGTGTGKSVAYLLPAIRWALQNRERTVVSTNTINLQEQLVEKDLPFLRRALGEPFRFALVKGRRNYVSIRRALLAKETGPALFDGQKQAELASIVEWLKKTQDGSLSDLSFRPSAEVWDEVSSESDVCLRAKCPHFEECFYQRARRDASSADVVVVNHHLLFSDLAVRRMQGNWTAPAVLPQYRRLILDEAHNLEESATSHLGATVSRRGLFRTLSRLENRKKGLLPAFSEALRLRPDDLLARGALDHVSEKLLPALEGARERAATVFSFLEDVFKEAGATMVRLHDDFARHPVWVLGLDDALGGLLDNLGSLLKGMELLRERIGLDEALREMLEPQLMELRGAANRVESAADALRASLRPGEDGLKMVRWMERQAEREGREGNLTLSAAPLDLSGVLRESVFQKVPSVVLTSATLATQGNFRFVRNRLGLWDRRDDGEEDDELRVEEAVYPSPFDYSEQALLVVPTDLPVPAGDSDPRHDEATVRAVIEHAKISDGGLFVLFTSYRALRHVAGELRRRRVDLEWPLFVHGEGPRAQLVQRFAASGRGILLGTTSFWEGVDVPGHPLRGLVIPKLPFKVPTEPVTAARIEAIEQAGGNSFMSYMLPSAAIRMKQGFGRLIRSRDDHGVVLVLDGRIAKKSYGRYFVDSLPDVPVRFGPWREVRDEMARFYDRRQAALRAG